MNVGQPRMALPPYRACVPALLAQSHCEQRARSLQRATPGCRCCTSAGEPLLKGQLLRPIYSYGSLQPVPEPFASAFFSVPASEEWLYDRGPGNLLATVRFRSGVVQSIVYGSHSR